MRKHFIPIPDDLVQWLRSGSTGRLILSLDGYDFRRIWIDSRQAGPCLFVSKAMLREIGKVQGDMVDVEIQIDPNPEHVDICEELRVVLEQDEQAGKRFYAMTSGRQRSLAHYVNSAKRVDTRIKRSLELARKLRTYTLRSD